MKKRNTKIVKRGLEVLVTGLLVAAETIAEAEREQAAKERAKMTANRLANEATRERVMQYLDRVGEIKREMAYWEGRTSTSAQRYIKEYKAEIEILERKIKVLMG